MNKRIFRTLALAASLMGLLTSCDVPIVLDLNQTPSKIVIEGLLTNQPGYQSVKVSRSVDFYSSGVTPRVTNATVTVTDDLGNVTLFTHNPGGNADSAGYYLPNEDFVGAVGRTYTLSVIVDGNTYEATDELFAVTPMDSVTYRINPDEQADPETTGKFYEALLYTKEPPDETNYYLFKFYRNDSLTFDFDTDIYYSDDVLLAENIDGIESPIFYGKDDTGRVEMFSLTRAGFIYYGDLSIILNNDGGGMFGPIPATPRTNLSNGALGFFQVSAIDINEFLIE